jgi:hypothetical protein
MDRHDGAGFGSDFGFDLIDGDIVSGGINVRENWFGAETSNGAGGGKKSEWGGDDLIAGANFLSHKRGEQGIGAGRDADREGTAGIRGNGRLALGDFGAEDEILALEDLLDGSIDAGFNGGVLGF